LTRTGKALNLRKRRSLTQVSEFEDQFFKIE